MYNQLIIDAFKKAQQNLNSKKVTHLSNELSEFIQEKSKEPYGERALRDHYNNAINDAKETIHLKAFVADALSVYLGHTDYSEYRKTNSASSVKYSNEISRLKKRNRTIIICSLIVILGLILYQVFNQQRWMVWENDHYVESEFDLNKHEINQLKAYKEDRIKNFKKIEPACDYSFFNSDGSPRVWYGKNNNKQYEYFSSLGLHPETGKTLKPITSYMIKKHLCKAFTD